MTPRSRSRRRLGLHGCLAGLTVALAAPVAPFAADAPRSTPPVAAESFYNQITRGVIRLEFLEKLEEREGEADYAAHTAGTAFFVWDGTDNYLVTARHVADSEFELRARVPTQRIDSGQTQVLELTIPPKAWVFHPQGAHTIGEISVAPVDVAVVRVPWIRGRRVKTIGYCPAPCPHKVIHQFAASDPEPPTIVLVFGFPLDLGFALEEQRPMARMGIVAMVAGDYFVKNGDAYLDARARLIDAPVYRGNSGSPVFSHPQPTGRFELLGLVTAANESYQYAVTEPVSRIAEALEAARHGAVAEGPVWRDLVATN